MRDSLPGRRLRPPVVFPAANSGGERHSRFCSHYVRLYDDAVVSDDHTLSEPAKLTTGACAPGSGEARGMEDQRKQRNSIAVD